MSKIFWKGVMQGFLKTFLLGTIYVLIPLEVIYGIVCLLPNEK